METQLTDDMDVFMSQNLIDVGISQVIFYNFEDVPEQLRFVIPFIYHTTGNETTFRNYLELGIHNRNIYTFHGPSTLAHG